MKRLGAMVLCVLLAAGAVCMPVAANSVPIVELPGADGIGVAVVDEENPIIVEHETLTFDIESFPVENMTMDQTATVTAQYTLHNPTDQRVTTTLLFPFGSRPSYDSYYRDAGSVKTGMYSERKVLDDTQQYDILVDGQPVQKTLRHSYYDPYSTEEFRLEDHLPRLQDRFMEDGFFTPTQTVTRYTCQVQKPDIDGMRYAHFDFTGLIDQKETVVYVHSWYTNTDMVVGVELDENEEYVEVYAIGKPLGKEPKAGVYSGRSMVGEKLADVVPVGTETLTFWEFALQGRPEDAVISEVDWYNAMLREMRNGTKNGLALSHSSRIDDQYYFMRWYEYEITVEPRGRIVNTVTAPIYPDIDPRYEPQVYRYRYLLSPAQKWDSFGSLEIVVNTPYYIIESNQGEFTGTEEGYVLNMDGLPEGELEFSLCAQEKPERVRAPFSYILMGGIGFLVLLALGAVVLLVVLFVRRPKGKAR